MGVFTNVNLLIFFLFNMMYSLTFFGWSFMVVAFIPSKRSSGIAVTLLHLVTFYLQLLLRDPATPSSFQYALAIFPNVCMSHVIKQIFFYNFNTDSGLTWSSMGTAY
jgi:hypothetical protein